MMQTKSHMIDHMTSHVISGQQQLDQYASHDGHKQMKDNIIKESMNHDKYKCQLRIHTHHV